MYLKIYVFNKTEEDRLKNRMPQLWLMDVKCYPPPPVSDIGG
jgi:hypothetical protein